MENPKYLAILEQLKQIPDDKSDFTHLIKLFLEIVSFCDTSSHRNISAGSILDEIDECFDNLCDEGFFGVNKSFDPRLHIN